MYPGTEGKEMYSGRGTVEAEFVDARTRITKRGVRCVLLTQGGVMIKEKRNTRRRHPSVGRENRI